MAGLRRFFARRRSDARPPQSSITQDPVTQQQQQPTPPLPPPPKYASQLPNGRTTPAQVGRPSISDQPRTSNLGRRDPNLQTGLNGHAVQPVRGKVQPQLLGVTRPSTDSHRPDTSHSLQSAIDRAAEQVMKINEIPKSRNPPKYIDIFQISDVKSKNRYNEDVAERNMDMVSVALNSGAHYRYVQTSTYQEEVANRNAYAAPLGRTSVDVVRPKPDKPHQAVGRTLNPPMSIQHSMVPGRMSLDVPRPRVASPLLPQEQLVGLGRRRSKSTADDDTVIAAKEEMINDPVGYHWRQNHTKAIEYAKRLPASTVASRENMKALQTTQYPEKPFIATTVNAKSRNEQVDTTPSKARITNTNAVVTQYGLSRADPKTEPQALDPGPAALAAPKERLLETVNRRLTYDEVSSPTAPSVASSTKRTVNLPKRTIMDLTGNDSQVFAEEYPESDFSEPTVGVAQSGSVQRPQPAQISTALRSGVPPETSPVSAISSFTNGSSPAINDSNERQFSVGGQPAPRLPQRHPLRHPPQSTFSPINTLVSVAPKLRPSTDISPISPVHPQRLPQSAKTLEERKLVTVAEIESESETPQSIPVAHDQQLSTSERINVIDFQPFEATNISTTNAPVVSASRASSQARPTDDALTSPLNTEPVGEVPTIQTTPPAIEMSPESLKSTDFTNPSQAFGVLTRDFAHTPTKPSVPRPASAEPRASNVGAKIKPPALRSATDQRVPGLKPRPKQVSIAATPTYISTFNEEEFARKQELARAALIKLQQSLDEDFMNAPARQIRPQARTYHSENVANQRRYPTSKGGPVAPSSTYIDNTTDEEDPSDFDYVIAETSKSGNSRNVHDLVTQSGKSWSSAQAPSTTYTKGKERDQEANRPIRPRPVETQSYQDRMNNLMMQAASLNLLPTDVPSNTKINRLGPSTYTRSAVSNDMFTRSPGEVSLSHFPNPYSRPQEVSDDRISISDSNYAAYLANQYYAPSVTASLSNSVAAQSPRTKLSSEVHRPLQRRGSTRSQASSNSAFSIPFHMIPDRSSSMRDSLVREEVEEVM